MFIIGAFVCFEGGPYAVWYLNNELTDKSTEQTEVEPFDINKYPQLVPPTDDFIEFYLTPNQSIILNNGTELFTKMFIMRKTIYAPGFRQHPRGIILKIKNESLWEGAKRCFASYFQTNSSANQKWFTEQH